MTAEEESVFVVCRHPDARQNLALSIKNKARYRGKPDVWTPSPSEEYGKFTTTPSPQSEGVHT